MTTQPVAKLSQWDALMLESLKAYGWSNEELIDKVQTGKDLPVDDSKFKFDYAGLTAFANENAESFEQAVRNGYQIKYNTIRGIYSWIFVALGQDAELILEPDNERVLARLTEAEAQQLTAVLSFGWSLTLLDGTRDLNGRASCKVAPVGR